MPDDFYTLTANWHLLVYPVIIGLCCYGIGFIIGLGMARYEKEKK